MTEEIFPTWKQEYIHGLEESLAFYGNPSKFEREKWVARRLVSSLGIAFQDEEFKLGEEPSDVLFRSAHFQVKEMLNEGRKRTQELKEKLKRAKAAESFTELQEHYTPQDITFTEIVERCAKFVNDITNHYGPRERNNTDLICYFNYVDYHETNAVKIENGNNAFRSFSIVSNRFCAVVKTAEDAPNFLSENIGRVVMCY
jgi:hypothetical protein